MAHSSLAIANEFLHRARDAGGSLTHMQTQKLVYFAHGWSLGSGGGSLIDEPFEAWAFGPVVRKLYDALKRYGAGIVPRYIKWGEDTPFVTEGAYAEAFEQISPFERQLIDWVADTYGKYHAYQLSALTHQEGSPWHLAFVEGQNRTINNSSLEEYFRRLINDGAKAA